MLRASADFYSALVGEECGDRPVSRDNDLKLWIAFAFSRHSEDLRVLLEQGHLYPVVKEAAKLAIELG